MLRRAAVATATCWRARRPIAKKDRNVSAIPASVSFSLPPSIPTYPTNQTGFLYLSTSLPAYLRTCLPLEHPFSRFQLHCTLH
mmetsp:Transcript_21753/g.56476  ORF Transcript_21753/g.56476 Transcript_21753/m.56476 type:complete len:83 (-) Transcript_21753:164-412(-)